MKRTGYKISSRPAMTVFLNMNTDVQKISGRWVLAQNLGKGDVVYHQDAYLRVAKVRRKHRACAQFVEVKFDAQVV